ncbi:hypothetical protein ACFQ48_00235 [Hymenobacter caeli]|uniref:Type IV secretory pathway VirB10-like protein n=1 Tax=Hymenobacter caeli TaxID=2735894 RepID=A0ABX2FJE8_9BACT|nr:hypothetical protein [Hymenobacter caeli]NRT17245.1 type IV secretory pathway VirB10-like protein [Hymenobacter caeli]
MRFFFFALLLAGPVVGQAQQMPAMPAAPAMPAQAMPAAPAMPTQAAGTAAAKATTAAKTKMAPVYKAAAPEQRAERMSQQISKQLGLDAATTAKVKEAALARAQKIDAIQTGTDTNKAKNTALQANAQDFKTALKGILTPEQFAKYTTKGAKMAAE